MQYDQVLEDPWGFTSGWLPQSHPCDLSNIICNRQGMVTGVDLAGPGDTATSLGEAALQALPRLWLKRLPEGGSWEKLGQMSLQTLRFDNARCLLTLLNTDV